LNGARGVAAIAEVDWTLYAARVDPRLLGTLPLDASRTPDSEAGALGAELRSLAQEQRVQARRRLEAYLRERVLDVAGSRVISEHDSFFDLGLDSLQAVAMRNRIERDLGVELGPSLIFDYPTLADLQRHLLADHLGIHDDEVDAGTNADADSLAASWENEPPESGVEPRSEGAPHAGLLAELEASLGSLERELES